MSAHNARKRRKIIRLAKYQDNLCFHCNQVMTFLNPDKKYLDNEGNADMVASLDHVSSVFNGGNNRLENIVIACRRCNSDRHHHKWTKEELERVRLLNEKRKDLIEANSGAQTADTFGITGHAAIILAEILDKLDGRDGQKLRRYINSTISKYLLHMKQLDYIPNVKYYQYFARILTEKTIEKLNEVENIEVRNFAKNVIAGIRKHRAQLKLN